MLDDTEVTVLILHVGGLGLYGHLLVNRDNNIIWLYALLTLNREGSRKGDLKKACLSFSDQLTMAGQGMTFTSLSLGGEKQYNKHI